MNAFYLNFLKHVLAGSRLVGNIREFLKALSAPFVGREEEAKVITLTLLSREHTVLIGEPGCVTGDTIISTADGRLLYVDDLGKHLEPGVYLLNLPVYPYGRATQLHIYEVNKVIQVVTSSGLEIKVTNNHPLMTSSGWVKAEDLGENDLLYVSKGLPESQHISIEISQQTQKIFEELGKYLASKEVSEEPFPPEEITSVWTNKGATHSKPLTSIEANETRNYGGRKNNNLTTFTESKKPLLNLVLTYELSKRVPTHILSSPKNLSASFLRGVFEKAGYVESSGICLVGSNLSFLKGIQALLLRYGILSKVGSSRELCSNNNFSTKYALKIDMCEDMVRFLSDVGFISEIKNSATKEVIVKKDCVSDGRNPSYVFESITSVKEIRGMFKVYDFHVPYYHAFFSNGFLSHNTAKSAMVRRAAELLNAKFFKYLLTRFTEPAELFGPLDIKALEEGRYVRLSKGKLPEAEIAFLDEVFKANSAILNALNSILQERILYDGYTEISVPLWSLFGASNEVPDDPEVEAVYDRFAARHFVKPLNEELWKDLLIRSWDLEKKLYFEGGFGGSGILEMSDLKTYHERVLSTDLSRVIPKLTRILAILENRGIHVSDRRKGKLMKFVAANAVLEGRNLAKENDLVVIKYLVPSNWEELERVEVVLSEELKTSFKYLRELEEIKANLKEVMNYVLSVQGIESKYIDSRFRIISRDLLTTKDRVLTIVRDCDDPKVRMLGKEVIELIDNTLEIIEKRVL